MIDIEKITKGIESCLSPHDPDCDLCPYDSIDLRCKAKLRDDIMILLKKQEPLRPFRRNSEWECSVCGNFINYPQEYCDVCGRKVNWDA